RSGPVRWLAGHALARARTPVLLLSQYVNAPNIPDQQDFCRTLTSMIRSIPQLLAFIGAQLRQDKLGRSAFVCWVSIPPYLILGLWALTAQLALSPGADSGMTLIVVFCVIAMLWMGLLGAMKALAWMRAHPGCYSSLL